MDDRKLKLTLTLCIILLFSIALPAQAQTSLSLLTPITGNLTPNGQDTWTFTAQNGAVLSFVLQAQSKDFDPVMTVTDSSGREVISSDDYDYPTNLNPLLEAITLPRTDTFTLTVTGVSGTAGRYTLTMLPGYSISAYSDDFSSTQWKTLDSTSTARQVDGQLLMNGQGTRQNNGLAFDNSAKTFSDFYAQANVVNVTDPGGWVVGMAVRRQNDSYYLLSINSLGLWRFTLVQNSTETVIHDWTPHPNIVPGANSFTIAVLAKAVGFDFFYNSGYIGSASDSTLTEAGQIGLMAGPYSAAPSQNSATFDDLLVTTPTQVNGADVIPQEVAAGDANQLILALRRNHVVSANGQMTLTIADSSVQYARPGINRVMFGRGAHFTNFAVGTTVDLQPAVPSAPAGCGLVFRYQSDTDYTLAYVDQNGEYGVSKRTGDTFSPGIYGTNQAISSGTHLLLVVANDNTIYFYIDRQLVGSTDNTAQDGEIGIAVVNFEPNSTSCHYTNFWLWNWS